MTRQRNDNHSTEFGLWLRNQRELDSNLGYVATNLDYVWQNYKTNQWILVEEKRYMSNLSYSQEKIYKTIIDSIQSRGFLGFYLIVFENTSPDDGKIFINKKPATRSDLINLLKLDINTINNFKVRPK